jgi:hypothetical protein
VEHQKFLVTIGSIGFNSVSDTERLSTSSEAWNSSALTGRPDNPLLPEIQLGVFGHRVCKSNTEANETHRFSGAGECFGKQ